MSTTKNFLKEFRKQKKEFSKKAQDALKVEFKNFFNKHESVKTIEWTQYTPYFNDGDECLFSVGAPSFYGDKNVDNDNSDPTDNCIVYNLRRVSNSRYDHNARKQLPAERSLTPEEDSLLNDANDLKELIYELADDMKIMFGDHVSVVANREGFSVSEYEHD